MMKAAVLAAMTAIALSSTPLLRFSSCPGLSAAASAPLTTHTALASPARTAAGALSAYGVPATHARR